MVTLDVVHADPAALHADLEQRLGGTVLSCTVTEVDYVRDVSIVDVRFRRPAAAKPRTVARTRTPYPTVTSGGGHVR